MGFERGYANDWGKKREMAAEETVVGVGEAERVIVVMDANRNKGNVDALEWALKHAVCRKDTVIVLGVLCDFGKKNSCFPLNMGISISGIWVKLEFSSQGQEVRPRELGEEIEKKREQYQNNLQPFYRQCKKNEVKLEVKLAFGICPEKITVEQALNSKPRWIVLDSHLKKYNEGIYGHIGCNIAVMKGKVATWIPSRAAPPENPPVKCTQQLIPDSRTSVPSQRKTNQNDQTEESSVQTPPSQSPSWYPLSWTSGFPRAFTQNELEVMTQVFAAENIIMDANGVKVYQGVFQGTPVLVKSIYENTENFWIMLKILSRARHRNIMNLVGYCCTGTSMFLLFDYPDLSTVEINFQYDESARNLSWKARWYIALEIGSSLRYLHEECADGAIVHLSVCSAHVVLSHGSAMLGHFLEARWVKDGAPSIDDSQAEWQNLEEHERLHIDIHGYGTFLIELMTGKSARLYKDQNGGQTLIDWALPLLEDGSMSELLDPRLKDMVQTRVIDHMADAALLCLKSGSTRRICMSEVLAVVRGN